MKHFLLGILSLYTGFVTFAQPIPVEITAGHNSYYYQHTFARRFDSTQFGFFHTSSLLAYYAKGKGTEIMSQSYLTYALTRSLTVTAGTIYATGPGFRPSVALQYFHQWKRWTWLLVPRADIWEHPNFELMSFLEYRSPLSPTFYLYSRLQLMSTWDAGGRHQRSYQYLRAGLGYGSFQFGLAANTDEYANRGDFHWNRNYGVFLRKEL